MKRKKIPYGTGIPVRLSLRQRDLIGEHAFCPACGFELARADGRRIRTDLTLEGAEGIEGHVAAGANRCEDRKLRGFSVHATIKGPESANRQAGNIRRTRAEIPA